MAAEAFEGPDVLRLDVAEEVAIAGLRQNTEESFPRGIPAILNLRDGQKGVAEFQEPRRFVGLVAGIADDQDSLHRITPGEQDQVLRWSFACRPLRRSTRRREKRSLRKSASR